MKASRKVLMDSSAHFNTVMSGDFDGKDVTEFHEDTSAVPSYGSAHFMITSLNSMKVHLQCRAMASRTSWQSHRRLHESAVPSYGSAHFVSILTNASYRIERGEIYNAIAFSRKSL